MNLFLSPGMLMVLVPALLVVAVIAARSRTGLGWPRLLSAAALRAVVALGVIAALARPADMEERVEPRALVVLFDVSDSIPANARRAAVEHLDGVLAGLAAERNLSVTVVPFAGSCKPLGTVPASQATLGAAGRGILLWDSEGRELRRQRDALREAPPATGDDRLEKLEQTVAIIEEAVAGLDPSRTDLAHALAVATAADPGASARSLLLYTDGRRDAGREPAWNGIAEAFSPIRVVPVRAEPEPDVVAEALRLPVRVRTGEPFDARVVLGSTRPGRAAVQLLIDGVPQGEREVDLPAAGRQELVFPDLVLGEGLHRFQAIARQLGGSEAETRNNVQWAAVDAVGRPRIALVEGAPMGAGNFGRAVEVQQFEVVRVAARDFPTEHSRLAEFQGVVLVEPSEKTLSPAQLGTLEDWVSAGGGLFVLTGVDGKALAAVRESPLARLLPVRIPEPEKAPPKPEDPPPDPAPDPTPEKKDPVNAEVDVPTVALVLAIDKSGSMQGDKILLAKEAVIASAKLLRPDDLVGVLAFDGSPRWAVSITSARRIEYIEDRVSRLTASGGTDVYPALVSAYRSLSGVDAMVKHVILLTDGYTPINDFSGLLEQMVREKITVSTVGVGDEFDGVLLANIAKWGKGTYDFTAKLDEVPAIFLRETRRAARLKEAGADTPDGRQPDPATAANPPGAGNGTGKKPDPPTAGGDAPEGERTAPIAGPDEVEAARGPLVEGFDPTSLPRVDRHAATDLRPLAVAALSGQKSRKPILAFWRFGLGRVLTWTSDLRERGAPAWARWESLPKFLARALRFAATVREDPVVEAEYRVRPGATRERPVLEWTYPAMALGAPAPASPTAGTLEPEGALPVERAGPASFAVEVPVPDTGRLVTVRVRHATADGREVTHRFGLARACPEELRDRRTDEDGLLRITGALRAEPGAGVTAPEQVIRRYHERGPDLVMILVFVFFVETLVRKLRR